MENKVNILGVDVDIISKNEFLRALKKSIESGEKFTASFVNPHIILEAQNNAKLMEYLMSNKFIVSDGVCIIFVGLVLGKIIK